MVNANPHLKIRAGSKLPVMGIHRHGRPKNVAKIAKIEENLSKPCPEGSVIKVYNLRNSPFPDLRKYYNGNVRPYFWSLPKSIDRYSNRPAYALKNGKSAPNINRNEIPPKTLIFS